MEFTLIEFLSIFLGVLSCVLGIIAIWLSFAFYKLSGKVSDHLKDSSQKINYNVEKLEEMFNLLYSKTFSLMKETMEDIRTKAFDKNSNSFEELIESKMIVAKDNLRNEFLDMINGQDDPSTKIKELDELVEESIQLESKVTEEALSELILKSLNTASNKNEEVKTKELIRLIHKEYSIPIKSVYTELNKLVRNGSIEITDDDIMSDSSIIKIMS